MLRLLLPIIAVLSLGLHSASAQPAPRNPSFDAFLRALWADAQARGVSRATFDAAFEGVVPDPRALAVARRAPEYVKPLGEYMISFVSEARLAGGRREAARWKDTLAAIEARYGVDPWIVVSIWGMETGFGSYKPSWDVIRSLATLAHARYRDDFFRNELLAALLILQQGHINRDRMLGSWAGAMGQSQFIPTSFLKYAVDFTGDGRRDIWTSIPDVLASIANYLREHGWRRGVPWGFEVLVPHGFAFRESRASFAEWRERGLVRADGRPFPAEGDAILFFPAGALGPAFVATGNYAAIKAYNISDAYALAAAHLADRYRGAGPIRAAWPADERPLSREQRAELQHRIAALGYTVRNFHGQIDFDLRDAIREIQGKAGLVQDGNPDAALLEVVRAQTRHSGVLAEPR